VFIYVRPFHQNKHLRLSIVNSVTRKLNNISPNFWKKLPQKLKISTSKLNLKAQNLHIKVLVKPKNTYNKPCVETACLGENWLG
jgi:hypothetical protein